jgi:hypothetical protein
VARRVSNLSILIPRFIFIFCQLHRSFCFTCSTSPPPPPPPPPPTGRTLQKKSLSRCSTSSKTMGTPHPLCRSGGLSSALLLGLKLVLLVGVVAGATAHHEHQDHHAGSDRAGADAAAARPVQTINHEDDNAHPPHTTPPHILLPGFTARNTAPLAAAGSVRGGVRGPPPPLPPLTYRVGREEGGDRFNCTDVSK